MLVRLPVKICCSKEARSGELRTNDSLDRSEGETLPVSNRRLYASIHSIGCFPVQHSYNVCTPPLRFMTHVLRPELKWLTCAAYQHRARLCQPGARSR
jgi:hypothetical protein